MGEITIHDLRREPRALMDKPIHSLLCYLPCAAMHALADQANVPRISELHCKPDVGILDETIRSIGVSLLPALRTPDHISRLFTDYVTLALAARRWRSDPLTAPAPSSHFASGIAGLTTSRMSQAPRPSEVEQPWKNKRQPGKHDDYQQTKHKHPDVGQHFP
jgi:hypothetical protein